MKTTRMRIAVGTMLVGLAGCASGPSKCKPPRCYSNPGPETPIPPQDPAPPEAPETAAPPDAAEAPPAETTPPSP
jgi:hypothetical protein